MPLRALWLLVPALAACGQSVRVYSEFERVGPTGEIVAADRTEEPREILSPALVRNGWTSFLVAVTGPAGAPLYIGQNPENIVKAELYRAVFVKGVPDGLEPVESPQANGEGASVYWLDLWVDGNAGVQRTRLELQLNAGDRWIIYPMELRIQPARVPPRVEHIGAVAPIEAPSSDSARSALSAYVCGGAAGDEGPLTIRKLILRNARQDMALAKSLKTSGAELLGAIGVPDRAAWCKAPANPSGPGPEWYLRVRDLLYKAAR